MSERENSKWILIKTHNFHWFDIASETFNSSKRRLLESVFLNLTEKRVGMWCNNFNSVTLYEILHRYPKVVLLIFAHLYLCTHELAEIYSSFYLEERKIETYTQIVGLKGDVYVPFLTSLHVAFHHA